MTDLYLIGDIHGRIAEYLKQLDRRLREWQTDIPCGIHIRYCALRIGSPQTFERLHLCRRYRRGSPARRNPKRSNRPCAVLSGRVYRRPDPLIYSQKYLMSLGLAMTWDNPDIHLEKGGVPVPFQDRHKKTKLAFRPPPLEAAMEARGRLGGNAKRRRPTA